MLSFPHLVVLFVIALIVFGPQKLPELARMLGKASAEFRKMTSDFRYALEDEVRELERQTRIREEEAAAAATAAQPAQTPPEGTVQRALPDGEVPAETGEVAGEADFETPEVPTGETVGEIAAHADSEPAPSVPQETVTAPQEKPSDDNTGV